MIRVLERNDACQVSGGSRLIGWMFRQTCQRLKISDAVRRGKLLTQMKHGRLVHRAKRETYVALTVLEGERRSAIPAKPATHLIGTLKMTRLASGPSHCIEGGSDVRTE